MLVKGVNVGIVGGNYTYVGSAGLIFRFFVRVGNKKDGEIQNYSLSF